MVNIRWVLSGSPSRHEDDSYIKDKVLQVPLEALLGFIGSEVFGPRMLGPNRNVEVGLYNSDVLLLNDGASSRVTVCLIKFLESDYIAATFYEELGSYSDIVDDLFYIPYQKRLMTFIADFLDETLPETFQHLALSDDYKTLFVVL